MNTLNYVVHLSLSTVLIVGGYQFYFWCQRHVLFEPRELRLSIDDRIPYQPAWVWIYSFLYYPAILYVNMVMKSPQQFVLTAASYLALLGLQMLCFMSFPVQTPVAWRSINRQAGPSERFLAFVQRFDDTTNSFPSMHTSVAVLTAFHLYPRIGASAVLFPALIGLSCLFTKQHYVIDVLAGAALGWVAYEIYLRLLA